MKKGHVVPLLLTSHGSKQCLYSLLKNRYITTSHPILEGKRILGSAYRWFVLADPTTDDCFLWNPKSSTEKIQLPQLYHSFLYNRCVLSKPPTDPDCLVVFKSYCTFKKSVCRIRDDEFVKVSCSDLPLVAISSSFQGEVYGIVKHNGIYALVTIQSVGKTIEFKGVLGMVFMRRSWVISDEYYLIESPGGTGEFFFVIKMISGHSCCSRVEFRVIRVDVKGLVCVELENLDGHTIFISDCGNAFCCPSSAGMEIKPNSIYYTNISGRVVSVYDLDDRSSAPLLPCPAAGRRYTSVNYWVDLPDTDIFGSV